MRKLLPYFLTTLALAAAGLAAHIVTNQTPLVAVSLFFVPVVLFAALAFGLFPAIYAAVATILLARFFFYAPIFSFAVADPVQVADLIIFTGVAVIVGPLADWARRTAQDVKQRENRLQQLYEVGSRLAAIAETDQIPTEVVRDVWRTTGHACALLLPDGTTMRLSARIGDEAFEDSDRIAAELLWQALLANETSDARPTVRWRLHPVLHGRRPIALLAIAHDGQTAEKQAIEPLFLSALLELVAYALERMEASQRNEAARIDAKANSLRDAIVGSITHDLRTPLAAILGSASTLENYGPLCSEQERVGLATAIREEAERLDRFLGRLFDLTRIRAGQLQPTLAPVDLDEVIEAALRHNRVLLESYRVEVSLPQHLPLPIADALLLQQVLINVIENAAKYAPAGSSILIGAFAVARRVELFVRDNGRGLTQSQCEQIFDRFYRVADGEQSPSGAGLGLTISRAFIEACGGTITADSPGPGLGATIRIRLAQAQDIPDLQAAAPGGSQHGAVV